MTSARVLELIDFRRLAAPMACLLAAPATAGDEPPLFPVKQGGKWGYINEKAEVVIAPAFDWAYPFAEGMARVEVGEKFGFITLRGELAVEPKFTRAGDFSEGLAAVIEPGNFLFPGLPRFVDMLGPAKVGFIGRAGKYVVPPKYIGEVETAGFKEGLACVRLGAEDRWGFINPKGEFVIPPSYDRAGAFTEGLARARRKGKRLLIDKSGAVRVELDGFLSVSSRFSEGLLAVQMGPGDGAEARKWGFVDPQGKLVVAPAYDRVEEFSEGLAAVCVGFNDPSFVPKGMEYSPARWGFIDKQGKVVIELKHWWVLPFSEGLAAVNVEPQGKFGYLDRKGALVIPPKFDSAEGFRHGLAMVRVGDRRERREDGSGVRLVHGKVGYIERSGAYRWEPRD